MIWFNSKADRIVGMKERMNFFLFLEEKIDSPEKGHFLWKI